MSALLSKKRIKQYITLLLGPVLLLACSSHSTQFGNPSSNREIALAARTDVLDSHPKVGRHVMDGGWRALSESEFQQGGLAGSPLTATPQSQIFVPLVLDDFEDSGEETVVSAAAVGLTINVPSDAATIQAGIDMATNGDTIVWVSDLDGQIGNGGSFTTSSLSLGQHNITVTATDSEGETGFSSVSLAIFDANTPVLVGAGDIADCGPEELETALLLDSIPGTVFTTGDNAYPDGTDLDFSNCYEPSWGRHKARTRPSPGNHDYNTPGATGYYNYFGAAAGDPAKGYYSYDLGDWHIVVLNSNCGQIGGCDINSAQGQWLQADLAANPATCTLAYWHHPRFSSSSNHGSNATYQDFWQILYDAGADVVLNGHDHTYERFAPQDPIGNADPALGIREFIVGTGGRSLYSIGPAEPNSEIREGNTYGVLKLTLHPTGYDWEFIPIAGQTFTDSGSATCEPTPGNQPPTVNAGPDQTITLPATATMAGTVSDDGIPSPPNTSSTWSQISGPDSASFADPNAVNTTATFSTAGVYVLRLTANDSELMAFDELTVTVFPDPSINAIDVRVSASSDDAEESSSGNISLSSSDLELILESSNQTVGMRFTGLAIPPGVTITNAYIQFQVDETSSGTTSLTIAGENVDNGASFANISGNISSRSRTTASVAWDPAPWTTAGEAGPDQQTPNIATVIQEIINRPGWSVGNSLVIIVTGSGKRTAESFNGSQAGAPLLHIEYQ